MRIPALVSLIVFVFSICASAGVPDVVMDQLRHDVRSAIIRLAPQGYSPPVEEVDEILRTVLRELNSEDSPFDLPAAELVEFRKDQSSLSFEEIARVMNALKKGIHNKPLPHLLAFYDYLLDNRALSPRQKILCYRFIMRVATMARVEIPPAEPAKP